MNKKKLYLLATAVFLFGISTVSAYSYSEIKNLSSGSTKYATETRLTTENYYTLKADKTGGSTATFTAYIVKPASSLFGSETIQAYGDMNFTNIMTSYSMKWDSKIGGGNKKLKFKGISGTISFIPTLIGS